MILVFIFDVKSMIPSVAEKDKCNPTDATEYGLEISKTSTAVESDVILSLSRLNKGAQMRNICIIPALVTAGVNPVIAIKNNSTGIPYKENSLLFLMTSARKPIRNDICIPDIDTM